MQTLRRSTDKSNKIYISIINRAGPFYLWMPGEAGEDYEADSNVTK
jgi:hypothetical protein